MLPVSTKQIWECEKNIYLQRIYEQMRVLLVPLKIIRFVIKSQEAKIFCKKYDLENKAKEWSRLTAFTIQYSGYITKVYFSIKKCWRFESVALQRRK